MIITATSRTRLIAACMLGLGLICSLRLPDLVDEAPHLAVPAGVATVLATVSSVVLWRGGHLAGRLLAAALSIGCLVAMLLNVVLGLPGAPRPAGQIGGFGVVATLLAVLSGVLLLLDLRRRSDDPSDRSPYAL